jgi:hypothetical protein
MAAAIWHTRSIYAAEALVRATFDAITPAGDGGCERTARIGKEFNLLVRFARRRFELLKDDLGNWRQQVRSGELDFSSEREDDFKGALRAFVALSDLLIEKFDLFHRESNLFLLNPRYINLLNSHKKEAKRFLDCWRSPQEEAEFEPRTVKWDKEQTRQLRAILASDD